MIKMMVVEDSPLILEFLVHLLEEDPAIQVIGTASNGAEAIKALLECRPDMISMDFHMPTLNGIETTRKIMETYPVPIVIVSGIIEPGDVLTSFRCLEAGALAVVPRPQGIGHPDYNSSAREYRETLKTLSEVKVVKRWPKRTFKSVAPRTQKTEPDQKIGQKVDQKQEMPKRQVDVIAIGASTGGPIVIERILSALPKNFRPPIMIMQHIANGFMQGFRDWLSISAGIQIRIAVQDELLLPSHVYLPPDGFFISIGHQNRISLKPITMSNGITSSVGVLFLSVAEVFGPNAVGVLLSGMGKDGAEELKIMKDKGAVTIVQNKESCVVFGMPGEATKLDAVTYALSPEGIVEYLRNSVGNSVGNIVAEPKVKGITVEPRGEVRKDGTK